MSSDNPSKFTEPIEFTRYRLIKTQYTHYNAIYKYLVKMLGEKQAQEIYIEANTDKWAERAIQETKDDPITDFKGFKDLLKKRLKSNEGFFDVSILADSVDRFEYRVTRCLIADVYRENDASDLGYAVNCHGDYEYAKKIHQYAKLTREHTLMQGGPYCDFLYTWEVD